MPPDIQESCADIFLTYPKKILEVTNTYPLV